MSHVRSNIDTFFAKEIKNFTEIELENMDRTQFDALPLSDQISIYRNHPEQYARLTGRTEDDRSAVCADDKRDASANVDEYERRVDQILQKHFHPYGA